MYGTSSLLDTFETMRLFNATYQCLYMYVSELSALFHVCFGAVLVSDAELKRLKEAFKRSSSLSGYMSKNSFFREVLGDNVPLRLAEVHLAIFDMHHC